jgi:hypothetical protein
MSVLSRIFISATKLVGFVICSITLARQIRGCACGDGGQKPGSFGLREGIYGELSARFCQLAKAMRETHFAIGGVNDLARHTQLLAKIVVKIQTSYWASHPRPSATMRYSCLRLKE